MSKKIITTDKRKNIIEAAKEMSKYDIGSLIVDDDGIPVGIVTRKDIMKKIVAKNLNPNKTKVEDVMTKKLITVPSTSSFMEASKKMRAKKINHLLISENGLIIGVISSKDVLKLMCGKK